MKIGLKAYKSRRADPDSWIVGGFATKEVIERAKFQPAVVGAGLTPDDVSYLGTDPGPDIDQAWWEDMLSAWFEEPDSEETEPLDTSDSDQSEVSAERDPSKA